MTADRPWISAAEASRLLRVSRATLYAYVSRGLVRSQATPGSSRERRYARDDVDRLRRRAEARRDPDTAAARALHWGMPTLESSISLIDGTRLYYRGHDAVALARARSLADVASLIWTGRFDPVLAPARPGRPVRDKPPADDLRFVARAQAMLVRASGQDPLAFDLRPASVARAGWRILHLVAGAAAGTSAPRAPIEQRLARAWHLDGRGADVVRSALVLCADHELNVSSFTARCVASAGSSPYAVVVAGLAALEGPRHGGASARVAAMLAAMRRTRDLRGAIVERLQRGEGIDGFGHPLYRDGDPRAAALVALLRERYPRSAELRFVLEVIEAAASGVQEMPNLDFALAAVARVLALPPGSPLALFAIGRTIGWIGHAIEQYATGELIRPRAKYVGVVPTVA